MTVKRSTIAGFLAASILAGGLAFAGGQYAPGVSDIEIKIGQTMPYSGPASAYGTIGKAEAAGFQGLCGHRRTRRPMVQWRWAEVTSKVTVRWC
jgi:hypothetical protein